MKYSKNFYSIVYLWVVLIKSSYCDFLLTIDLLRFDNGQGYLANGEHCSQFWYAQRQCNIKLKLCVDWIMDTAGQACQNYEGEDTFNWIDLGFVTENSNVAVFQERRYNAWSNPMQFVGQGSYKGFRISLIAVDVRNNLNQTIDSYNHSFANSSMESNDFFYYSNIRPGVEPTLLGIAWKAIGEGVQEPPTIPPPIETTTALPTSNYPRDCEDAKPVNSGAILIQPNPHGPPVMVYCEVNPNGILTVVQSRGSSGNPGIFDKKSTLLDYQSSFGDPDPSTDYNFWLGLDNLHYLTTITYTLQIDYCCGSTINGTQIYENFQVSGPGDGYTLNAQSAPIGLDSDIGTPFYTYDTYPTGKVPGKSLCKSLKYPRNDTNTANYVGGWWFGQCYNNFNGHYYHLSELGPGCTLPELNSQWTGWHGPGIELDVVGGTFAGVSYTRVRMAVHRGGPLPISTDFCAAVSPSGSSSKATQLAGGSSTVSRPTTTVPLPATGSPATTPLQGIESTFTSSAIPSTIGSSQSEGTTSQTVTTSTETQMTSSTSP